MSRGMLRVLLLLVSAAVAGAAETELPAVAPGGAEPAAVAAGAEPPAPPADAPAPDTVVATVKVLEGTVEWRPDPQAPWQAVKVGQELSQGADIRTGFRARCILDMGGSLVQLEAMTVMRVAELKRQEDKVRTRLYLKQGRTQSIVEKGGTKNDFAIVTPSATLSVRGTQGINCSFWKDVGSIIGLTGPGSISVQDLIGKLTGLGPGQWTNDQAIAAVQYLSQVRQMALQQQAGLEVTNQFPFVLGPTFVLPPFNLPPGGTSGNGGQVGGGGQDPGDWQDPVFP